VFLLIARIPRLNTIASSFRRRMIRSQPWFSTDSGRLELSLLVFKGSLYWLPILDAEETNVRTRRDEANEARVLKHRASGGAELRAPIASLTRAGRLHYSREPF